LAEDVLHHAVHEVHLSPAGENLLTKGEKAVRSASELMKHLSPEDELQEMLYQAKLGVSSPPKEIPENAEQFPEEMKIHMKNIVETLKLFVRSHSFRVVVGEISKLANDLGRYVSKPQEEEENKENLDKEWDDIVGRLKHLFGDLVAREEFGTAVENLVNMCQVPDELKENVHLQKALRSAKKLLEHLAEGYSLDKLSELFPKVLDEFKSDERLQRLYHNALHNKEYVESEDFDQDVLYLKELSDQKWFGNLNEFTEQLNSFMDAVSSDKVLRESSTAWSDFLVAAVLDENGRPTFKPELIFDLAQLAKLFAEKLKVIQVKKLMDSNDEADYVLDNLYINCENLSPKLFNLDINSTLDVTRDTETRTNIKLTLSKMETHANNVQFWYSKKKTPKMSDVGSVDLTVNDVEVIINLVPSRSILGLNKIFQNIRTDVKINEMSMKFQESQHQVLYTLLYPWVEAYVRESIENELEEKIQSVLLELDHQVIRLIKASRNIYGMQRGETEEEQQLPEWGSRAFNVGQ
jgi:hypothetical protein